MCIGLVNGKHYCVVDETTEEQFRETHGLQYGFCPLLPEANKVAFIDALKKAGFSIGQRWKG